MRCFLIVIFLLHSSILSATETYSLQITINQHVVVGYRFNENRTESANSNFINTPNGLFWNLLVWSNNAQNVIQRSESIFLDIHYRHITISSINNNEISEILLSSSYPNYIEFNSVVFRTLNSFYNIKTEYDDTNFIEVFLINYQGSHSSYYGLFLTEEEANAIIESDINRDGYNIEKIMLSKENINDVLGDWFRE